MSSRIQPLPIELVHRIAAGEVIDSLAAVVRELIDNSIDAGATQIYVALWPDRWQVRVTDNGKGMSLADLREAARPHSTSKMDGHMDGNTDLLKIKSLGFRGEALHSLAQLGQLEIWSRSTPSDRFTSCDSSPLNPSINPPQINPNVLQDPSQGWRVTYTAQGDIKTTQTVALAPGTIVTVSDLFAQWPARRRALPAPAQQLRAIQLTIQHMALCHPTLTWQVEQNPVENELHQPRPWFTLWPDSTPQAILCQILRNVMEGDLAEFFIDANPAESETEANIFLQEQQPVPGRMGTLYLLLGFPDRAHRRRPDWVKVAVNGRVVKLPELEQVMLDGFRRTLPRDRFPICFVHLMDVEPVDWNRHPAKSEIYLPHLKFWQHKVAAAIGDALKYRTESLSADYRQARVMRVLKTAEQQRGYRVGPAPEQDLSDDFANRIGNSDDLLQGEGGTKGKPMHGDLRAIAQVHNMYILAEHPAGIWLIEQHIAHERVLYEQICDRWELVPLTPPLILSHLSDSQQEQLQRLGLEIDRFGEHQWAVRHAPQLLAQRDDCVEALIELSLGDDLQTAQVATACRSAIRNGTPLTRSQMQDLLNQWQQTRNPRTCPHGRPICLRLDESSLSRFFRRYWVIGKSHGI